ncbi:GntR family transcriptional regulator [Nonomuraea sp. NPDC050478]|uniref:GntR family transcriptional regulator n=1 Tax=Nonomuraea sp. NPDC050478 TaxID=3364365 RepID=UPI0037901D0C
MMSLESVPPKYAQLVQTLQRRIESGDYPPGENQLIQEFGVSRPTVVAALRVQREQGWIESQQGKGRFVRGRPAMASIEQKRPGQTYLTQPEIDSTGEIVEVGAVAASNRVAVLLDAQPKNKAFIRRRLIVREGVRFDHIVEQITARMPTTADAGQLAMPKNAPLLAVFGAVRDASGRPLVVVEVLLLLTGTSWKTPTRSCDGPAVYPQRRSPSSGLRSPNSTVSSMSSPVSSPKFRDTCASSLVSAPLMRALS